MEYSVGHGWIVWEIIALQLICLQWWETSYACKQSFTLSSSDLIWVLPCHSIIWRSFAVVATVQRHLCSARKKEGYGLSLHDPKTCICSCLQASCCPHIYVAMQAVMELTNHDLPASQSTHNLTVFLISLWLAILLLRVPKICLGYGDTGNGQLLRIGSLMIALRRSRILLQRSVLTDACDA